EVEVLGAGAGTLRTAWRYQPGKASQLAQVESTGRQPTSFVFNALGLRHGELLIGATDIVMQAPSWPEAGRAVDDWIAALGRGTNDLEAPAARIEPVISDVLSALRATADVRLVRMSGSGATCFAVFASDAAAEAAGEQLRAAHPGWWVHAGSLS
ncbi:MAG: hypothetical protein ACK5E0_00760, partial [Bradyrhizobium sp.]